MKQPKAAKSKKPKYKSRFEEVFGSSLTRQNIPFNYESKKVKYVKEHTYNLDFDIDDSCLLIETKGYFKASDRAKHLDIKKQHPHLDIRFIFMHDNKIHKMSNTRYSDWCKKHGFKYRFVDY